MDRGMSAAGEGGRRRAGGCVSKGAAAAATSFAGRPPPQPPARTHRDLRRPAPPRAAPPSHLLRVSSRWACRCPASPAGPAPRRAPPWHRPGGTGYARAPGGDSGSGSGSGAGGRAGLMRAAALCWACRWGPKRLRTRSGAGGRGGGGSKTAGLSVWLEMTGYCPRIRSCLAHLWHGWRLAHPSYMAALSIPRPLPA